MSDNTATWNQAFHLLCDQQIGRGMSRVVWSSKLLPDCVIKVEDTAGQFQNVIEWETWLRVRDTPHRRWFAPCRWLAGNGSILVMERTRTPAENQYLKSMPLYLTDFKRANYGMLNGKLVCHDYGTHMLFDYGMTKRMKPAKWWNDD